MKREVLIVPLDEIQRYFSLNDRQDIKIVVPQILSAFAAENLSARGKKIKKEQILAPNHDQWHCTEVHEPNQVIESRDYAFESPSSQGPFAIAFANEKAQQQEHYHARHSELYYSLYRLHGYYRSLGTKEKIREFDLLQGGLLIFQPLIVHLVNMHGITLVIESPSVVDDRFTEE